MNYTETLSYLYDSAPLFQQIGAGAYKSGLENSLTLDVHFGHPHQQYKTIHVAGTNGKGSCSHTLAAILQSAGYRVGLYTSPHLTDFRERIRVNGEMMPEQYVIDFVKNERDFFEPLHPSFFELTTAMAFKYFAEQQVDVAVVEVGLGGRLDCTNIITPCLSLITNISLDHVQFLGNTLRDIAREKAGIIKAGIPVVIGETNEETRPVFQEKADAEHAPIIFAEDSPWVLNSIQGDTSAHWGHNYQTLPYGQLEGELGGKCQILNTNTILHALDILKKTGFCLQEQAVRTGFAHVTKLTGLKGRWQIIEEKPLTICDTGHNVGGMQYIQSQLSDLKCDTLRIVLGMVNDKDIRGVLELLPRKACYYFTQASVKRALPAEELQALAYRLGLNGKAYPSVKSAFLAARSESAPDDVLFIGGSNFIVADLLTFLKK